MLHFVVIFFSSRPILEIKPKLLSNAFPYPNWYEISTGNTTATEKWFDPSAGEARQNPHVAVEPLHCPVAVRPTYTVCWFILRELNIEVNLLLFDFTFQKECINITTWTIGWTNLKGAPTTICAHFLTGMQAKSYWTFSAIMRFKTILLTISFLFIEQRFLETIAKVSKIIRFILNQQNWDYNGA